MEQIVILIKIAVWIFAIFKFVAIWCWINDK
jgi:hypothetical protein